MLKTRIPKPDTKTKLHSPVPKSWYKAAGLLRGKRKAMEQHLRQIRKEWDHYPTKA